MKRALVRWVVASMLALGCACARPSSPLVTRAQTSDPQPGASKSSSPSVAVLPATASPSAAEPNAATTARASTAQPAHAAYQTLSRSADIDGVAIGDLGPDRDVTLVVFFASWCEVCRRELAVLTEIQRSDARTRIVGVNAYEEWGKLSDEQRLRQFLGANAPWLRVVTSTPDLMKRFGGVRKIPAIFVFDRRGSLVRTFRREQTGAPGEAELRQALVDARTGSPHSPRPPTKLP
jgi:thiol-disulfide isomerase/thioredoxin